MRVDYTLPALQPGVVSELPADETALTFRDRLRAPASIHVPVSWEQQLRLDVRPMTATFLAPPRRPPNMEINDAETERARWRSMLFRHSRLLDTAGNPGASSSRPPVQTMLEMLLTMQDMEDAIASRSVSVSRG